MRRQLTEAQKEAARLRREKFRGYVQTLTKMSDSERLELAQKLPVIATCEGHALSLHNQCLIALPCPGATLVGGFRQWKRQGRAVKRGEHGLMIWIPCKPGESVSDTPQPGEIDGDAVHVPSVYTKRLIKVVSKANWIEQRTVRARAAAGAAR